MNLDKYLTPKKEKIFLENDVDDLTKKQIFNPQPNKEYFNINATKKKISEFIKQEKFFKKQNSRNNPRLKRKTGRYSKSKDDLLVDSYKKSFFQNKNSRNKFFEKTHFFVEAQKLKFAIPEKNDDNVHFLKNLRYQVYKPLMNYDQLVQKNKYKLLEGNNSIPLKMEVKTSLMAKEGMTLDKYLHLLSKNSDEKMINLHEILSEEDKGSFLQINKKNQEIVVQPSSKCYFRSRENSFNVFESLNKQLKVENKPKFETKKEFLGLTSNIYQEFKDDNLKTKFRFNENHEENFLLFNEKREDLHFFHNHSFVSSQHSYKSEVKIEQDCLR
jgi:hypothetical protein